MVAFILIIEAITGERIFTGGIPTTWDELWSDYRAYEEKRRTERASSFMGGLLNMLNQFFLTISGERSRQWTEEYEAEQEYQSEP